MKNSPYIHNRNQYTLPSKTGMEGAHSTTTCRVYHLHHQSEHSAIFASPYHRSIRDRQRKRGRGGGRRTIVVRFLSWTFERISPEYFEALVAVEG